MWLGFSIEFWITLSSTIAIAIATAYVTIPRSRPNEIKVQFSGPFSVLNSFGRESPKLRILYDDDEVSGEIAWLEGTILNVGSSDVGPTTVIHFPVLKLGKDAEWLEFSLQGAHGNIDASFEQVSRSEIKICWSLLKPGEEIPFQALVRAADADVFWRIRTGEEFSIAARIENVDVKCDTDTWSVYGRAKRKLRDELIGVIGGLGFMLVFCGLFGYVQYWSLQNIELSFAIPDRQGETYTFKNENAGKLLFERYPDRERNAHILNSQLTDVKIAAPVQHRPGTIKTYVAGAFWVAVFVAFLVFWPMQLLKFIRLRRLCREIRAEDARVRA